MVDLQTDDLFLRQLIRGMVAQLTAAFVLDHPFPIQRIPVFLLPGLVVLPSRVLQFEKDGHPATAVVVGILFTLNPVHLVYALLQFTGREASSRFAPTLPHPLRTLNHTVLLRLARRIPNDVDLQSEQPQGQVRGEFRFIRVKRMFS